jgi:septum formation protein
MLLASSSPRRRELLSKAGYDFEVDPADIPEEIAAGEAPLDATFRLAGEKALAVALRTSVNRVVLAADTTVVCEGEIFGKPIDQDDACAMLTRLSGRNHHVITAWTAILVETAGAEVGVAGHTVSTVRMRELSRAWIRAYVRGGEPLDKAGAYAVQGEGRSLVAAVIGSRDNVIGLPVAQVARGLAALGIRPRSA